MRQKHRIQKRIKKRGFETIHAQQEAGLKPATNENI